MVNLILTLLVGHAYATDFSFHQYNLELGRVSRVDDLAEEFVGEIIQEGRVRGRHLILNDRGDITDDQAGELFRRIHALLVDLEVRIEPGGWIGLSDLSDRELTWRLDEYELALPRGANIDYPDEILLSACPLLLTPSPLH